VRDLGWVYPGSIRVVKRRVALLGLDTSHFTGQRTWSDAALRRAATQAYSWNELLEAIGIKSRSGDERTRVKAHAVRLGLDSSHLSGRPRDTASQLVPEPELRNLREAATSLATCWFSLRGFGAAMPIEPTIYDLLVSTPRGIKRVQVKTTTYKSKAGWLASRGGTKTLFGWQSGTSTPLRPRIDRLVLHRGWRPSQVIGGRVGILLRTYSKYIVGSAAGLMAPSLRAAISGRIAVSPGGRGPGAHQAGGARPVPAAVRLSRAPRWSHGPPGRDGRWPPDSAIRKLPRNIRPSRNIRATGVAQSFRGSRMFRANGGGGTGAWDGTASAPLHAPARPHAPAGRARPPARARCTG
jgi:hypothetical protein